MIKLKESQAKIKDFIKKLEKDRNKLGYQTIKSIN
jgi:hypothetical protein